MRVTEASGSHITPPRSRGDEVSSERAPLESLDTLVPRLLWLMFRPSMRMGEGRGVGTGTWPDI
jgi:hypothetical protein